MKDPAVLFYTQDFLTGTMLMDNEQKGKYITLLCLQHQNGRLSEKDMLKICGEFDEDIWSKFQKQDGYYYNKRMLTESEKRANFCKSRRNNLHKEQHMEQHMDEHMENENENENINEIEEEKKEEKKKRNGYSFLLKDVIEKYSIQLPEGFEALILEWLKYKSEKGQSYKETGLKTLIKSFIEDTGGKLEVGRSMLRYSMSKNYNGLFKEKSTTSTNPYEPKCSTKYLQR